VTCVFSMGHDKLSYKASKEKELEKPAKNVCPTKN
jgi:hypothetical protein